MIYWNSYECFEYFNLIFYKILDFHFLHFSIERKFIIIIIIISFSGFF